MSTPKISISRIIIKQEKDFTPSILADLLQCKLCLNIVSDPHDCICCNQTFCFSCIKNYIKTNKKCPYDLFFKTEDKSDEDELVTMSKLKPSSSNISKILNSIKVTCLFSPNGCNEEINLWNVTDHEKTCIFQSSQGLLNNNNNNNQLGNEISIMGYLSPPTSSLKKSELRKLSLMSFRNLDPFNDPIEQILNATTVSHANINDKLEKIIELLQYIQYFLRSNNAKDRDSVSETPKFNTTAKQIDSNFNLMENYSQNNNIIFPGNNGVVTPSPEEKILDEIENMKEKLTKIESSIERGFNENKKLIKNLKTTENQGLTLTDLCERENNLKSPKTKKVFHSANRSLELNNQNLNLLSSPFNEKEPTRPSKKVVTSLSKQKSADQLCRIGGNKKDNCFHTMPNSPSSKIYLTEPPTKKNPTKANETNSSWSFLQGNVIDKIDKLENNLTLLFKLNTDSMKIFLEQNCVEELKKNNLELILDSTNLMVQKFDEVMVQLKSIQ